MNERGDIRWFRFDAPDNRRPVLVLGREDVLRSLSQIPVVPLFAAFPPARFLERMLIGDTIIDSADFFRLDGAGWDSIGQLGRPSAGPYTSDGMRAVFRDDHTVFALGNGADNSGLWEGDF